MNKAKRFFYLIKLIAKYMLSFIFLIFKAIFKELSIVIPYENYEYKNTDNNRLKRFKVFVVVCYILAVHFFGSFFNTISDHTIVTLDILFLFYLLIPFLNKTYSKYLPSVN